MKQPEFDPKKHELWVRGLHIERSLQVARVALFNEMIDYHLDGDCTFDEAMAQFHHDADLLLTDPPETS